MYPDNQVQVNVQDFLTNPTRVRRQLNAFMKDKTIAAYAFGLGPANQGAVVYDEVLGHPEDSDRDVAVVAPGAEFPAVTVLAEEQRLAKVAKYGGRVDMTWEAIRRNETDTLAKRLTVLSNLIIKKVDAVTVAAVASNPSVNTLPISPWVTDPATNQYYDPIGALFSAKSQINDNELGYEADLALINPLDANEYFLGVKSVREQLPKENISANPVLSGDLGTMAGMEWIKSARVPRGTIYMMQRGVSGSVRDEEGGAQSNSYDANDNQVRRVQGWRSIVPIITDPLSITRLTGFHTA